MLVLSSADVEAVLNVEVCLEAMEEAFRENEAGRAISTPWCNLMVRQPDAPQRLTHYVLRTASSSVMRTGLSALRINSDRFTWLSTPQGRRKVRASSFQGNPLTGFLLLFDNVTALPVALMPDRYLQKMRVAATNALGVKYLARPDASRVGLLGSGWQATAQLQAFCAVRSLRSARVFSPTPQHREEFAARMSRRLGIEVEPVDKAAAAAAGADILAAATNSIDPVIRAEWLRPGIHISLVKEVEIDAPVLAACDLVAANLRTPRTAPVETYSTQGWIRITEGIDDGVPGLDDGGGWWREPSHWKRMISLEDLLGDPTRGRRHDSDVTLFLSRGVSHQFSSVGAAVLRLARLRGLGRQVPLEWLLPGSLSG